MLPSTGLYESVHSEDGASGIGMDIFKHGRKLVDRLLVSASSARID